MTSLSLQETLAPKISPILPGSLQELQRGLIVPDLDPVRVAAVACGENAASRPV